MKIKILLLLILILTGNNLLAETYYISNNGDDTNDGLSENSPWKTLAKASEAAERSNQGGFLQPGDKLLFKRGETFIGQLILWCSGTETNPIEIGSYGNGELPILTGVGANLGMNNNGDAIEVIKMTNTSHILINHIHITNDRKVGLGWTGSGNTSYGILVKANKWGGVSKCLTFRNLKFTDIFGVDMLDWEGKFTNDYYNAQGFFFDSEADHDGSTGPTATEVRIDDVLIEDCYFYNLGSTGISIRNLNTANNPISDEGRNSNYVIRNNHFEKLGGDGVVFASVNNGLVEHNEFIDLGWGDHTSQTDRYFGRGEGCWIWDSHNIMVQYNKQFRASGYGDTYGSNGHVDFYCKNAVFQYNYSEDTEGGFVEILGDCENITFRYNISVNDGHRANGHHRYSIWLSGYIGKDITPIPSNNCYIYNNTVYLDKTRSLPDVEIFAKNTYIYNNIFYALDGAKIGDGGVSIDIQPDSELVVSNNLFYGDIATNFTNLDSNKIISQDPLFTNPVSDNGTIENFNIQSGSPVLDAGISFPEPSFPMAGIGIFADVTEFPTTDVYGVEVDFENFKPNIGASNAFNGKIAVSKDSDNDSVLDEFDQCPNTPANVNVNAMGCTELSSNNFTIEATDETCPNKDNGSILLKANTAYNYIVNINDTEYEFSDELEVTDIPPDVYEFCIQIKDDTSFKQCFSITINEGQKIQAKLNYDSKKTAINITKGTPPFTIYKNGKELLKTFDKSVQIDANYNDIINVKSAVLCEGDFSERILGFYKISPNPVKENISLKFSQSFKNATISIYDVQSRLLFTTSIQSEDGASELSLPNHIKNGIYFINASNEAFTQTEKFILNR